MPPVQAINAKAPQKAFVIAKDFSAYIAGSILMGISIDMFTAPNHIAPGGLSGICTMINYTTGLPI